MAGKHIRRMIFMAMCWGPNPDPHSAADSRSEQRAGAEFCLPKIALGQLARFEHRASIGLAGQYIVGR